MVATLITEINSHPYNENTNIKVCEMQTVSCLERSGCDTFWTADKKQFNLDS